jgi:7-keto-8-aminopelargonate synthetase-like enzyme
MMLGPEIKFVDRDFLIFERKKLLYLGGIDYHRMSNNPMIIKSMSEAAFEYGLNPTGSRTTTGNHILYIQLENKVANFFDTETAVVFPSGYLANIILLQAVAEEYDTFFIDETAHSSIVDAANGCAKKIVRFKFLDAQNLKEKLQKHLKNNEKPLVMTDGVFPARGAIPPLRDYAQVINKYNGKILIDDAHAMAVVGRTGKGSWEEEGIARDLVMQTGTLSKGFGVFGGIIPGEYSQIKKIHEKSLAFVGSTGLSLPLAAAAIRSVSYFIENKHLISSLQEKAISLKLRFKEIGFDMPATPTPIFSITYHDIDKNKRLYKILIDNGIYPPFINYPGAPPGGHFRFILTSSTPQNQIDLLFDTIKSSI